MRYQTTWGAGFPEKMENVYHKYTIVEFKVLKKICEEVNELEYRMTTKFFDHQNSKICNPGGKPTYAVSNSFSELAYFSPIHQKLCSHSFFYFEFFLQRSVFFWHDKTFLETWAFFSAILLSFQSNCTRYLTHSGKIIEMILKILKSSNVNLYPLNNASY